MPASSPSQQNFTQALAILVGMSLGFDSLVTGGSYIGWQNLADNPYAANGQPGVYCTNLMSTGDRLTGLNFRNFPLDSVPPFPASPSQLPENKHITRAAQSGIQVQRPL